MNEKDFPSMRNLDGFYFRVQRGDKWLSLCFTDLTAYEQMQVIDGRSSEWLQSLAVGLAEAIRQIGDYFDIAGRC